jgi:peptide/nickel transport system substrate-binding protein
MADAMSARALAAVVALIMTAAGCSKTESGSPAPRAQPIPGVVRIVGIGSIDSLIPELSGNESSPDIAWFWGAWLFRVGAHGELVPELATEVPTLRNGGISANGLTITYHLRKGVRWHDGAPFDARDVIFSWHAILNPRNNVLTRTGYDDIASMRAPDPHTVVVALHKPYAPAVATFFGPSLAPMCILPAHILGSLADINRVAYGRMPVGTGPFIFDRYESQSRIVLRANPDYWRGAPKIKEVDFLIVPDPNTRALMMRTGEADLYYQPADNLIAELASIPDVHTIDLSFNEFWYLVFNAQRPPLDDVRVRRAVAMSVDRDYVIKAVAGGLGSPANGDQPSYSWAFDPDARAPRFDPAIAERLLTRAGWLLGSDGYRHKGGAKLSISYVTSSGYGEGRKFAPVFQEEMKRVGIDATVKLFPTSLLFAAKSAGGIMDNGKFDVAWSGWIGGVDPDDATLWGCDQMPPAGYNMSYFCDPRIDEQEKIALTSYDQETRRRAYQRIQSMVNADVPVDFLFWTHIHDAMRGELKNYRPAPTVTTFSNPWQWQI